MQVLRLMMNGAAIGLAAGVLAGCAGAGGDRASAGGDTAVKAGPTELIPRAVLFGNPDRSALRVSPDGRRVSFLAPVNGVMNVWVAPIDAIDTAKAVTNDTGRGVRNYGWAFNGSHMYYLQDRGGDENWKVISVDLDSGREIDLTPEEEITGPDGKPIMLPGGKKLRPAAQLLGMSDRHPDEILIGLNSRDPQLHDVFRVNVRTGGRTLVLKNTAYAGFEIDNDLKVRMAARPTADGGQEILRLTTPPGADGTGYATEPFMTITGDDSLTSGVLGFDAAGATVFYTDSRGRNTGALMAMDLGSGAKRVLAEDARSDAGGVISHPTTHQIQAVSFNYLRNEWKVLDDSIKGDLEYLRTVADGEIMVGSRSLDDRWWTVSYLMDNGPVRSYLYDRQARKATFVFSGKKDLERYTLAKMHPVVIRSSDGLDLVSYLTLPPSSDPAGKARPARPLPMVLVVHGGPWARDAWGYNPTAQWLANRGYAVLMVNFRGSTGFGKSFVNAGNKEWAGKMHEDLIDAVNWAIREKVADPKKVAILGGSYGGYSALVGVTFTPKVFACAVDIVGPSNIVTLLSTIPPYWKPMIEMFANRVGDHRTEEGRKFLESRSPLTYVDRIERPLLIGQGANDPRVKQSEADQIVQAMTAKKIPVTYVLFPDEGHGFARPPNRMAFNAVAEAFLARHLGGRAEPIGGDFIGSSVLVPTGADQVPELPAALAAVQNPAPQAKPEAKPDQGSPKMK